MSERIINKIKKIFISLRVIFIKNDLERWKIVSKKAPTAWYERNKLIAEIIPDKSKVLDIGCGDQNLKSFLKKNANINPVI
jgi:2-polyprenyl-3-methyl-5-hydroxy-6-metoxy-1,4-benzoquinol methylase